MLAPIRHSWPAFRELIQKQITRPEVVKVLEIGPGLKPYLSSDEILKARLEYHLVDIDPSSFLDPPNNTINHLHNLEESPLPFQYDLIISHMVLEHLQNPKSFHQHILSMIHEGTTVCHFFATKYGLPSMANRILPSFISDFIIYKIQKRNPDSDGKYPAYYRRCTGPLKRTKSFYTSLGYNIIRNEGYLGHGYLSNFPALYWFENRWNRLIQKINSPYFCSNAILVLKKKI